MIEGMKAAGVASEPLLDLYLKTYNDIIAGRPKDLTVGIHVCRGNFRVLYKLFRYVRESHNLSTGWHPLLRGRIRSR